MTKTSNVNSMQTKVAEKELVGAIKNATKGLKLVETSTIKDITKTEYIVATRNEYEDKSDRDSFQLTQILHTQNAMFYTTTIMTPVLLEKHPNITENTTDFSEIFEKVPAKYRVYRTLNQENYTSMLKSGPTEYYGFEYIYAVGNSIAECLANEKQFKKD